MHGSIWYKGMARAQTSKISALGSCTGSTLRMAVMGIYYGMAEKVCAGPRQEFADASEFKALEML